MNFIMRQLKRCIVIKQFIIKKGRTMKPMMNGKIKRLSIQETNQKGWSIKVKIVRGSGLKLGRKEVTKDGLRNKAKSYCKNGKNVGIKKWIMMKK